MFFLQSNSVGNNSRYVPMKGHGSKQPKEGNSECRAKPGSPIRIIGRWAKKDKRARKCHGMEDLNEQSTRIIAYRL